MVETIRLESGHTRKGIGGSNPSLSASITIGEQRALRAYPLIHYLPHAIDSLHPQLGDVRIAIVERQFPVIQ